MIVLGAEYTRNEINLLVGGSKQTYLPTKNGLVVAACLTIKLNPQAPQVIICGSGKQISRTGLMLAQQTTPTPVFIKIAPNKWQFKGFFKAANSHVSGLDFERLVEVSGRSLLDVSRVIEMIPA